MILQRVMTKRPREFQASSKGRASVAFRCVGRQWLGFWLLTLSAMACIKGSQADEAGPDYLKEADTRSPLGADFKLAPYLAEQHWQLHLRSYLLDRNIDNAPDKQALAVGAWLTWRSAYWLDLFQFSATAYTSNRVVGDKNKDGSGLLQDGQKSYGGFSNIYAKVKLGNGSSLRLGRFEMNTPYINKGDIRMIPNSFQGAVLIHKLSENWDAGATYITHIKDRTSSDFEKAYDRAGIEGDEGIAAAGLRYHAAAGHSGGAYGYYAPDVLEMIYAEYNHRLKLNERVDLVVSTQYTHQSSRGNELGGEFSGDHYGAKLLWESPVVNTTLAYTSYEGDRIRSDWGSIPGYTSVMIKDFNRRGERAYLLGFDKDLAVWNLPGWHIGSNLTTGATDNSGVHASPDQSEWDLNLKYTFQDDLLHGLSLFFRHVRVNQKNSSGANDANDISGIRMIANYNTRF